MSVGPFLVAGAECVNGRVREERLVAYGADAACSKPVNSRVLAVLSLTCSAPQL